MKNYLGILLISALLSVNYAVYANDIPKSRLVPIILDNDKPTVKIKNDQGEKIVDAVDFANGDKKNYIGSQISVEGCYITVEAVHNAPDERSFECILPVDKGNGQRYFFIDNGSFRPDDMKRALRLCHGWRSSECRASIIGKLDRDAGDWGATWSKLRSSGFILPTRLILKTKKRRQKLR